MDNPNPKETPGGVFFKGPLRSAYEACLWSRLANRILLVLARFETKTPDELYSGILDRIPWEDHLTPNEKIAVDFTADRKNTFHSLYAALRIKDAVADRFRVLTGHRPSVDTEKPDIRINVHVKKDLAQVSLDLSGESLHKRFYRTRGGTAPLKENLAAAILLRARWPQMAKKNAPLLDPFCGSGTLLIEAALMALDMAPGLRRKSFGFTKWKQHDRALWKSLLAEAEKRADQGTDGISKRFFGFDRDPKAIANARNNAIRAGVEEAISFRIRNMESLAPPPSIVPGLLVANPPYGERMGKKADLENLYQRLGNRLKKEFQGWSAAVFTASPHLAKKMGIRARKQYRLFNGPLPCKLLCFQVENQWFMQQSTPCRPPSRTGEIPGSEPGAQMFQNRLRKNLRILGKWAQKEGVTCYRLYDADMPEYAVAIDLYEKYVHVQEYRPPATVSPLKARERLGQILSILPETLKIPRHNIVFKVREKKKKSTQYERFDSQGRFFQVGEKDLRFLVNLTDYLDTGLFLDQRPMRERLRRESFEKRVLNLFCYTATATVCAAAGGAVATTSVDMSRTYLNWARRNLALNHCEGPKHRLVRADCLEWITNCKDRYDLIYLDPPTFSNSKRMMRSFDVQRDHKQLLAQTLKLLAPGGILIFSSNKRKFRLDSDALRQWHVKDITRSTIPRDYERNPHIHKAFEIRERN